MQQAAGVPVLLFFVPVSIASVLVLCSSFWDSCQAVWSYCSSFRYPQQAFWSFVPPSGIRAKHSSPIVPRSRIRCIPSSSVPAFCSSFQDSFSELYRITVCEIRHQRSFSSFLVLRCIAIVPSSSPGIRYPEQNYLSVFVLWTVFKFGGDTPLSAPAHCLCSILEKNKIYLAHVKYNYKTATQAIITLSRLY